MKKICKSALSVLLCLIMVFGSVAIGNQGFGEVLDAISVKASAKTYSVGDYIYFGSYPQSKVTDSSLISALNRQTLNWKSFNYYSGTGEFDGNMTSGNFMKYADISYGDKKYRAVKIESYRPYFTSDKTSADMEYYNGLDWYFGVNQNTNGYLSGHTYWFEFEPIKWRILDPETGLVMCETLIDSQPFSNYVKWTDADYNDKGKNANDWETSSLRVWLNNTFYEAAFSDKEMNVVKTSTISNLRFSGNTSSSDTNTGNTKDKVFLLSWHESMTKAYGFGSDAYSSDPHRMAKGSDYAKCQGLYVYDPEGTYGSKYSGYSVWWLRTAGSYYCTPCYVKTNGYSSQGAYVDMGSAYYANSTCYGIRPALKLDLEYFDDNVKIMSYNLYNGRGTSSNYPENVSSSSYPANVATRAKYISQEIIENAPDSVGVQEATQRLEEELKRYLTNYSYVGELRDKGTNDNNEANFIYYRKDKYKCVDFGTYWLSSTPYVKYTQFKDANYNRIFTYALLENIETGFKYFHINTHVDLRDKDKETYNVSIKSLRAINDFINEKCLGIPVVLTGDFNFKDNTERYKTLTNEYGYKDTKALAISAGKAENVVSTCHEYQNKSNNTIDFIFLCNNLFDASNVTYNVITDSYTELGDAKYPSDHHAVVSQIKMINKNFGTDKISKEVNFTVDGYNGKTQLNYDSDWFGKDSTRFNLELAKFCANYAMMGYCYNKDTIKTYLGYAGFTDFYYSGYDNMKTGRNEVNYFLASRDIFVNGQNKKLVFLGTIGSYENQWYSNFDPLGYENSNKDKSLADGGMTHRGFADAREFAYKHLSKYISELVSNGTPRGDIKILLTGHSRGAATANLLAAKLIDNESSFGISKDNIYTYTFATPNVTKKNTSGGRYNGIFNIVNPEDFVTKVMLNKWGFGRYGITYVLPSKTNTSAELYTRELNKTKSFFKKYTGEVYDPYKEGEKCTYKIIKEMGDNVETVNELYTDSYLYDFNGIIPREKDPFTFFKNTLLKYLVNNDIGELIKVALEGGIFYFKILCYFAWPDIQSDKVIEAFKKYTFGGENIISLDGIVPGGKFKQAHQMQTYAAYMNSLSSTQIITYKAGYENTVNCPVDIEVYDSDGTLVGKIVNNVIDETVASGENAIVMDVYGDSKSFWLPSDEEFAVKLIGNDNGKMDYTVSTIDSDTGEMERVNFFDVEIVDGEAYTGTFESENFELPDYSIVDNKSVAINPTEVVTDESTEYSITVKTEGEGNTNGNITVTSGDYVNLVAEPAPTSRFIGWYENNELVSSEPVYAFVAKSDRDFVAMFNEEAKVTITNYKNITVDLKSSVTLHATANIPDTKIAWFNADNNQKINDGVEYNVSQATETFRVYAAAVDDNGRIIEPSKSETETVTVKTGFIQTIIAFFRNLFGRLPIWIDNQKH